MGIGRAWGELWGSGPKRRHRHSSGARVWLPGAAARAAPSRHFGSPRCPPAPRLFAQGAGAQPFALYPADFLLQRLRVAGRAVRCAHLHHGEPLRFLPGGIARPVPSPRCPGTRPCSSSVLHSLLCLLLLQVVDSRSFRADSVLGEFRVRLAPLRPRSQPLGLAACSISLVFLFVFHRWMSRPSIRSRVSSAAGAACCGGG